MGEEKNEDGEETSQLDGKIVSQIVEKDKIYLDGNNVNHLVDNSVNHLVDNKINHLVDINVNQADGIDVNELEGNNVNQMVELSVSQLIEDKGNLDGQTKRAKKDKVLEIKKRITTANQLFVRNDFCSCISTLKSVLVDSPKNANAYFMLGLVFEEMKDDIKAYNFYIIASQLMKTNYGLWEKLYELSTKMNLLSDKLYYIQMLQRNQNRKELVEEKLQLYRILKSKYKILETKIELFYFNGVDFDIFTIIRNETKHKTMTARCATLLIRFFKQYPGKCGLDFLQNIIRLQYETGYLYGTRNLIEKYLLNRIELSKDIRLIYIICVLVNSDPPEILEQQNPQRNIDDLQFQESLFEAKEVMFEGFNYNEEIFDIYEEDTEANLINDPEFVDYNTQNNLIEENNQRSKTLNLNELLEDTSPYEKLSDIDALINDRDFWNNFTEFEYVKGLLSVLLDLKMEIQYVKILKILEIKVDQMKEFVFKSLGSFYFDKEDLNSALYYYQKTLEVNSDNNIVKSKLYEIYKRLGNIDLANKFRTISSLVNFVDDIRNEEKSNFMSSVQKCNENRDLYSKSRLLFNENITEYFEFVKPLVDDFLENRFLFTKHKKFKLVGEVKSDNFYEDSSLALPTTDDSLDQINNVRFLSLHGLNSDEWSAVLLEFIIANITRSNIKEASLLLRKSLECEIFKKRADIYLQFIFFTIKHSIYSNDLNLLSICFKKAFSLFKDYSWANFYFYLMNFFSEYIRLDSYGNIARNIRRIFKRNHIFISDEEGPSSSTEYKSLDLNLLLSSFFIKNIAHKSYKVINNITLSDNVRDNMTYYIILIMTYKSRRNETKNEMLKKGLDGLKNLSSKCNPEELCNLSYNIGVAYHTLGYVGIAEKHYTQALKSQNPELKRMSRLSLMSVYRKTNYHLYKKLYDEDDEI